MITVPTTLVLGAGVSMPYGYPSGLELIEKVVQGLKTEDWRAVMLRFDTNRDEIEALRTQLPTSRYTSIDAFLEFRDELEVPGRLAIALALSECEDWAAYDTPKAKGQGIYSYVLDALRTAPDKFRDNRLRIVTFNYDRSLEHFLYTALEQSYKLPGPETLALFQAVPIVHLHGWLGPLPWQADTSRPYGPLLPKKSHWYDDARMVFQVAKLAEEASREIVIVSQVKPNAEQFEVARKYLEESERVYFLGFRYHRESMTRLGIRTGLLADIADISLNQYQGPNVQRRYWRGSAMDLGKAETATLRQEWRIGLFDDKLDALSFLKEYAPLI